MRGKRAKRAVDQPAQQKRELERYTEDQKIAAVTALKKLGGLSYEGIAAAREVIGSNVSRASLHNWTVLYGAKVEQALGMMPPLLGDVVTDASGKIERKMNSIIERLLDRLDTDEVIKGTAGRDLSVMFGIFEERLRLRLGYSPDEHEALRILRQTAQRTGWDHISAMRDLAKIMDVRSPLPANALPATSTNQAGAKIEPDTTNDR